MLACCMTTPHTAEVDLAALIRASTDELRTTFPELERAEPSFRGLMLLRAFRAKKDLETKILEAVALDPSFGSLRSAWVSFAGSGNPVNYGNLPAHLVGNVLAGEPAEEVLDRLRAFAAKGTSSGWWYAAISGVTVPNVSEFATGIDLVPWAEVQDSSQKERLSPTKWRPESLEGLRPEPNCALRFKFPERRVLFPNALEGSLANSMPELDSIHKKIANAIRAITALLGRPVAVLGSWPTASDQVLQQMCGATFQFGDALNDVAMFSPSNNPVTLDVDAAGKLFESLERFHGNDANAIKTALDRIILALRQFSTVGKAIDLGIALEVILLHEMNGEQGELKYRSAMRGAHFVGGDKANQKVTFKTLKDVYDLRSKAVHTGRLPDDATVTEKLERGMLLITAIARKIIELEKFPNWEDDYVFSVDK